ncbi:MAG: hypothetical protein PHH23_01780 [Paludibacteraceae bacterium]|nr:hypothetical protein [Paludibacteraceae bacterium]
MEDIFDYKEPPRGCFWTFILVLAIVGTAIVMCCSCKTIQQSTESTLIIRNDTVEKLVPYALPQDSSTLMALLECDKNGRVVIRNFDLLQGKNALLLFRIDSLGHLLAKCKNSIDTIYVPVRSTSTSIVSDNKETKIVTVERNLNGWEKFQIWGFWILILVVVCYFAWKYRKPILKFARKIILHI